MEPLERMKRIQELMALGSKATAAEKAEVKKLLDEQMAWAKKNPADALEAQKTFELSKKTPEVMKAEFEAAKAKVPEVKFDPTASTTLREEGLKSGISESILPAQVTPPSKLTTEQEQVRTDYGKSIREKAIAEGKSPAVADAMALEAYNGWYPEMKDSGWKAEAAPDPSIEYPMGETPAPQAPVSAPTTAVPSPASPAPKPNLLEEEDPHSEATMVGAGNAVKAEAATIAKEKKPGWKDKIKKLGTDYGVPMLEILEAVGKQRGGITTPTMLDKKYQEKLEQKQREYMETIQKSKEEREAAQYEKRAAAERTWQEQQAIANRTADVAARREELSSREKLLQMQLAGQKGAATTGASIIPK